MIRRDMRVYHRGFQVPVSHQLLDRPDIRAGLQQVRGKTVSQGMRRDALADVALIDGLAYRL